MTHSLHADLYQEHYTRLFSVMRHITHNPELAEDIVQDSFVKLMECYSTLKQEEKVVGMLNVIARHLLIDRCRHQQIVYQHITQLEEWHHELPDNKWADPQESCPDHLFIASILAHLSASQRHTLALVAEGYSYDQIAKETGQKGIKTYIKRARNAARLHYQQAIEEDIA